MNDKNNKPGRIVMVESVPSYRGCMALRKGSVQRLDEAATKDLVGSGKAEFYEDKEKRASAEKRAVEAKKTAEKAAAVKPKPKPSA